MSEERKRSQYYYNGQEDARQGAGPDYSQATTEQLLDYRDGYRDERARMRAKAQEAQGA